MAIFSAEDQKEIIKWLDTLEKKQLISECETTDKTSKELSEELRAKLYECVDNILESIQSETASIITGAAEDIKTKEAAELAEEAIKSEESMETYRKLLLLYFLEKDLNFDSYEYLWRVAKKIF